MEAVLTEANVFSSLSSDGTDSDPPPLKWSTLSYGFAHKEDRNAEEELQAGGDRRQAAAG
jgi:hypothetical protein